jgi:5-(carboxyamino)imidazole ribonucleotide mutase
MRDDTAYRRAKMASVEALVAIIMGSDSDWPLVKKAAALLTQFDVGFDVQVLSAHRTPEAVRDYIRQAMENNVKVFIAAAGKAAHLAGTVAANTTLPVIGIPVKSSALDGMDALLATVQMPTGVPVATVAIDGAENAALLAVQILAIYLPELAIKLRSYRRRMTEGVLEANAKLRKEVFP